MSLETFHSQKCVLGCSCERDSVQQWPEIKHSDVLTCLKYIPPDINQTVDWNQLGQNNSLFLCNICKGSFGSLSKLSFDLGEIQIKINHLVESIVLHVRKGREIYNGTFLPQEGPTVNTPLNFPFSSDIQAAAHQIKIDTSWQSQTRNENVVDNDEDYFDAHCNYETASNEETTSPTKRKDLEIISSIPNGTSPLKSSAIHSEIQCKEQTESETKLPNVLGSTSGYECSTCGKKFARYTILKKHECGKPTVECETCGLSFSSSGVLKLHTRTHSGEKPFKCELCGFSFSIKANLGTHMQSKHSNSNEKNFECDICGKKFSYAIALQNHKTTHTKTGSYKCDSCDKSFKIFKDLKLHLLKHESPDLFQCDLCEKTFSAPNLVQRHKKRAHFGQIAFNCDLCDKSFASKENLTRHKMMHTGEKPLQCSQCGKGFRVKSDLRIHMVKNHENEDSRKFTCEICGKTYRNTITFQAHMRHHDEKYKVKCDICGKSYFKGNLKAHISSRHGGVKPFKCEICDKRFLHRNNLRDHVARFCHICKIFVPKKDLEALAQHQIEAHTVSTILYPEPSPTSPKSKVAKIKSGIPNRKSQRRATRDVKCENSSEDEINSEYVDDVNAMEHLEVKIEIKTEDEFSEIEDSDF